MNRYRIVAIHVFLCCLTVTFYAVRASDHQSASQDAAPSDVASAIRALGSLTGVARATAA